MRNFSDDFKQCIKHIDYTKEMLMQNGSIFFAMFFCAHMLVAQCSDAGICSLRERTRKTEVSTPKHSIGISYIFGRSSNIDDITYHTAKIDGSFSVMETGSIMLAIPFNAQSGPLGSVLGIGDIIILWNHVIAANNDWLVSLQLGVKLATGDAKGNGSLPQQY